MTIFIEFDVDLERILASDGRSISTAITDLVLLTAILVAAIFLTNWD
jgi:hypothetical protein